MKLSMNNESGEEWEVVQAAAQIGIDDIKEEKGGYLLNRNTFFSYFSGTDDSTNLLEMVKH